MTIRSTCRALTTVALATALAVGFAPAASAQSGGVPLRSSVASQPDPNPSVVLRGRGWGHSVGLSQYGAYAQARAGRSYSQILQHYYGGTRERTWGGDQRVTVRLATGEVISAAAEAVGGPITWRVTQGTAVTDVVQPSGQTWRVLRSGAGVILRPAAGADVVGDRVEARMTSMDRVEPARGRLRTHHPSGAKQYAYGYVLYAPSGTGLAISNRLPLESYLRGLGEVPSSWGTSGGQAALQAQAVIARGYVLARDRDTCATPACQVFVGYEKELEAGGARWTAAVDGTAGRYLEAPDGSIATTYYSSSHGGRTEASEDSWAYGGAVPYLRSVDDPWSLDAVNPMRSWTTVASNAEFRRVAGSGLSRIQRVTITSRTAGGSPRTIEVEGPEGVREFSTTPSGARSARACNRAGYAGNSLRCDLRGTVRNAAGDPFAGANGNPPSSQIRSIGFGPFADDDGNTHEYAIVFANAAGIAQGKTDGTFDPRSAVTRGQMASFLFRTFDVPVASSSTFRDAQEGPHAEAIAVRRRRRDRTRVRRQPVRHERPRHPRTDGVVPDAGDGAHPSGADLLGRPRRRGARAQHRGARRERCHRGLCARSLLPRPVGHPRPDGVVPLPRGAVAAVTQVPAETAPGDDPRQGPGPAVPVVVAGWVGSSNLGDELLYAALVRQLEARGGAPLAISTAPAATAAVHGTGALPHDDPRTWLRALGSHGHAVFGGGGLLQDESSRWNVPYHLARVLALRARGARHRRGRARRWAVAPTVDGRDPRGARGRADRRARPRDASASSPTSGCRRSSRRTWRSRCVHRRSRCATTWSSASGRATSAADGVPRPGRGVPGLPTEGQLDALAARFGAVARDLGLSLRFVALQADRDGPLHDAIADRVRGVDVTSIRPDLTSLVAEIGRGRAVVGMRFHAAVLGLLTGRPVLAAAYSSKVAELATDAPRTVSLLRVPLSRIGPADVRDLLAVGDHHRAEELATLVERERGNGRVLDELLSR